MQIMIVLSFRKDYYGVVMKSQCLVSCVISLHTYKYIVFCQALEVSDKLKYQCSNDDHTSQQKSYTMIQFPLQYGKNSVFFFQETGM